MQFGMPRAREGFGPVSHFRDCCNRMLADHVYFLVNVFFKNTFWEKEDRSPLCTPRLEADKV